MAESYHKAIDTIKQVKDFRRNTYIIKFRHSLQNCKTYFSRWYHMNFASTIHCPYQSAMWLQIKVFLASHLNFPFNYSVTLTWLKTVINVTFTQTLFCIGVKTCSIDGIPYWKDGWELFILNMNFSCCNLCIFMSISHNYSYNLETYIYISLTNNEKRLVQD